MGKHERDAREPELTVDSNVKVNVDIPPDVTRDTLGFVQRLLGPVADACDFLSDRIRFFRWKAALETLSRAREIAEQLGIEPSEVPLKFLVPFMEKCSLEARGSEITDQWAKLLLSASVDYTGLHSSFIDILATISPEQAKILRDMWRNSRANYSNSIDSHLILTEHIYSPSANTDLGVDTYGVLVIFDEKDWPSEEHLEYLIDDAVADDLLVSMYALERQRLVIVKSSYDDTDALKRVCIWANLTPYGAKFVEACEGLILE